MVHLKNIKDEQVCIKWYQFEQKKFHNISPPDNCQPPWGQMFQASICSNNSLGRML